MADTLTKIPHNLQRPKITVCDPLHEGYFKFDADIPPAAEAAGNTIIVELTRKPPLDLQTLQVFL